LSNVEFRIVLAIIRKTYGWDKKEDYIALSQLSEQTGIMRQNIPRVLRSLEAKGIVEVVREKKDAKNHKINSLKFIKYSEKWVVLEKKKVNSAQNTAFPLTLGENEENSTFENDEKTANGGVIKTVSRVLSERSHLCEKDDSLAENRGALKTVSLPKNGGGVISPDNRVLSALITTKETKQKKEPSLENRICAREGGAKRKKFSNGFIKPTIEDVEEYLKESKYTEIDATSFWHHYESKDWMIGSNRMKKWKSAVSTWHQRNLADQKRSMNTTRDKINASTTASPERGEITSATGFTLNEAIKNWNHFAGTEAMKRLEVADCLNQSVYDLGLFPSVLGPTELTATYWQGIGISKSQWQNAISKYAKEILNRTANGNGYQLHRYSMYDFMMKEGGYLKYVNL